MFRYARYNVNICLLPVLVLLFIYLRLLKSDTGSHLDGWISDRSEESVSVHVAPDCPDSVLSLHFVHGIEKHHILSFILIDH